MGDELGSTEKRSSDTAPQIGILYKEERKLKNEATDSQMEAVSSALRSSVRGIC